MAGTKNHATSNIETPSNEATSGLRTSRRGLILLAAAGVAACQTARPNLPRETMSVAPVRGENDDIEVSFTRTVFPDEEGYLPPTNVYLQHEVRVVGKANDVRFSRASIIDSEGTVIPAAGSSYELEKPPEYAKKTAALSAGMIGSTLLTFFTPLGMIMPVGALAGGAYVASETTDADRQVALSDTFAKKNVQQAIVYQDTTFSGLLFLPAVAKPQAIIFEYETRDGEPKRLRINLS